MEFRFGLSLAVLLVAFATRGHAELQCYVCDNCAKIDKNTPLETCGPAGSTTVTTITTTEAATVTTTTGSSSTVTTSTPAAEPPSTTEQTTTEPPTTVKTTAFPTPPTEGPLASSTTGHPTPPNVGTIAGEVLEFVHNHTGAHNSTAPHVEQPVYFVTPSHEGSTTVQPTVIVTPLHNATHAGVNATVGTTLLLRQRRNLPADSMTFHCFKVEKKYDGVYGIQRGCMGVLTEQSVCGELKAANGNHTKKCHPCSTSMCNSSSSLGVSIATLLIVLISLVYRA